MTTVYPTSAVSILCDCPYTGKTQEIKPDPENDARKREQLRKELRHTQEELTVARNVLTDTRGKLGAFKRILSLELGWVASPYVCTFATWKDRVREESYLKSELIHLVDYLRQCDPRYRDEPVVHPCRLSASAEDLMSVAQEEALRTLYHGRTTVHRTENERRTGESLCRFLELKEDYENKLHHNKMMEREIANVKNKISELQRQYLEDSCLIDYITEHHFEMKGCFVRALPSEEAESGEAETLDSKAEHFKELWEQSKREKTRITNSVQALNKNMEVAHQRIVRAENICSDNITAFRTLIRRMKGGSRLSKLQPRRKENFGKFSAIQFRTQRSQLEAAVHENDYLRKFLRKSILSKTDDLKRFQKSLQSTAEKYRGVLENVRNSSAKIATTTTTEPPKSK